jgi:SPP1 gp7 family putative phage head morphogenesis protein
VVATLRKLQADILGKEEAQMRLMARRWLQVESNLEAQIAALSSDLYTLSKEGVALPEGKLLQMERYHKLLAQAQTEFSQYADYSEGAVSFGQTQFAHLGIEHAITALDVASVGMDFNRLNVNAVQNMIGLSGDGQPIGELLRARMVKDPTTGLPLPGVHEKLTQTLINATAQGWNPRRTASAIRDDLSGGLDKALEICRTEQLRVYRSASQTAYQASGIVVAYQRLAAFQTRTCPACLAASGQVYDIYDPFFDHVRGRCTLLAILRGQAPTKLTTGEEWFGAQSEADQLGMLGPTKLAALKNGDFAFADLAKRTFDPTWGGGLKVATLGELGLKP